MQVHIHIYHTHKYFHIHLPCPNSQTNMGCQHAMDLHYRGPRDSDIRLFLYSRSWSYWNWCWEQAGRDADSALTQRLRILGSSAVHTHKTRVGVGTYDSLYNALHCVSLHYIHTMCLKTRQDYIHLDAYVSRGNSFQLGSHVRVDNYLS